MEVFWVGVNVGAAIRSPKFHIHEIHSFSKIPMEILRENFADGRFSQICKVHISIRAAFLQKAKTSGSVANSRRERL